MRASSLSLQASSSAQHHDSEFHEPLHHGQLSGIGVSQSLLSPVQGGRTAARYSNGEVGRVWVQTEGA